MRAYILPILCTLTVAMAIASSGGAGQDGPTPDKKQKWDKSEFESQFPLTDAHKPEPSDPGKRDRWRAKSKKFKGVGLTVNENSGWIGVNSEWDIGLVALPVANSDLIVIGEVTDAQSYLTESKDWVYSEFTIQVGEVLKNDSTTALKQDSLIVVDRGGGRVRFPNGHIVLQYVSGQGMPRVGRRYALFLKRDAEEQSTHVLTGYELRGGRVFPLDNSVGATYKDADQASFLSNLRAAITNR